MRKEVNLGTKDNYRRHSQVYIITHVIYFYGKYCYGTQAKIIFMNQINLHWLLKYDEFIQIEIENAIRIQNHLSISLLGGTLKSNCTQSHIRTVKTRERLYHCWHN